MLLQSFGAAWSRACTARAQHFLIHPLPASHTRLHLGLTSLPPLVLPSAATDPGGGGPAGRAPGLPRRTRPHPPLAQRLRCALSCCVMLCRGATCYAMPCRAVSCMLRCRPLLTPHSALRSRVCQPLHLRRGGHHHGRGAGSGQVGGVPGPPLQRLLCTLHQLPHLQACSSLGKGKAQVRFTRHTQHLPGARLWAAAPPLARGT